MPATVRRLAISFAAVAVVLGAVGARPQPVAAATTIAGAETAMVAALNQDRASAGIVAARVDSRLMAIARARAADMATRHYFGHTQPDGRNVFDILNAKRITWYGAGEIIAWNTWPTLDESTRVANSGWMGSGPHHAIIMSSSYNYVGVGLAIDSSGKKLWAAVFMKGPDRTGGWVAIDRVPARTSVQTASIQTASVQAPSTYRRTIRWRGGDVRLSVLTAGFRNYQIQRKRDGGAYAWVTRSTTLAYRTMTFSSGHVYSIRIRSCDRVGNCGVWRYVTVRG
jgi:uncharacterized protein YkwD